MYHVGEGFQGLRPMEDLSIGDEITVVTPTGNTVVLTVLAIGVRPRCRLATGACVQLLGIYHLFSDPNYGAWAGGYIGLPKPGDGTAILFYATLGDLPEYGGQIAIADLTVMRGTRQLDLSAVAA